MGYERNKESALRQVSSFKSHFTRHQHKQKTMSRSAAIFWLKLIMRGVITGQSWMRFRITGPQNLKHLLFLSLCIYTQACTSFVSIYWNLAEFLIIVLNSWSVFSEPGGQGTLLKKHSSLLSLFMNSIAAPGPFLQKLINALEEKSHKCNMNAITLFTRVENYTCGFWHFTCYIFCM